jgi:hypothetical protein
VSKVTKSNYKKHQLYPAVARAMSAILQSSNFVAPVELLMRMERLSKKHHEDWRFGRVPYLERVCAGNLSKLSDIVRILQHHAAAIGLRPSQTVYHKCGKGDKRIQLRFSKFGDPAVEAAYARHYVSTYRPALRKDAPAAAEPSPDDAPMADRHPTGLAHVNLFLGVRDQVRSRRGCCHRQHGARLRPVCRTVVCRQLQGQHVRNGTFD